VPVSEEGVVAAGDVEAALTDRTVLVTVMHSNNEVGAIQPVPAIAQACRPRGILVHTDAAQSVGKVGLIM
jgi:cysteine desulfurase